MFIITQQQIDHLSQVIMELTTLPTDRQQLNAAAITGNLGQTTLINVEGQAHHTPTRLLDSLNSLRFAANLAQFTAALYPRASSQDPYVLSKYNAFQADPLRYFATLDGTHRHYFLKWLTLYQPIQHITDHTSSNPSAPSRIHAISYARHSP